MHKYNIGKIEKFTCQDRVSNIPTIKVTHKTRQIYSNKSFLIYTTT